MTLGQRILPGAAGRPGAAGKLRAAGILLAGGLLLVWPLIFPAAAWGVDVEALAQRIADSLQGIQDPHYRTVAFSRVKQQGSDIDVDTLIDFTNVKVVQGHRLRVIDRSKLQLILKEQQVQLTDFISTQKYRDLGQLLGVDLFIYGTLYRDALVLKAIDVQNSAIAGPTCSPSTKRPRRPCCCRTSPWGRSPRCTRTCRGSSRRRSAS